MTWYGECRYPHRCKCKKELGKDYWWFKMGGDQCLYDDQPKQVPYDSGKLIAWVLLGVFFAVGLITASLR